jgi:hypothetical protein
MHLTEDQVQRILHGEEVGDAALAHQASCLECQALVRRAGEEEAGILDLLHSVDQDPPSITAAAIADLAGAPIPRRPRQVRWAAVLLLACILGGGAYALPGSPLKGWLAALLAGGSRESPGPTVDSIVPTEPPEGGSGIAVDPGTFLAIGFDAPRPGGQVRVTLTDRRQVVVQGPEGAVRFTSGPDRLDVLLRADSIMVAVSIPRTAARVAILAGDRQLLLQEGSRIISPFSPNPDGSYTLPLAP